MWVDAALLVIMVGTFILVVEAAYRLGKQRGYIDGMTSQAKADAKALFYRPLTEADAVDWIERNRPATRHDR